jgi:transglutaminase-like putative cysteine protease
VKTIGYIQFLMKPPDRHIPAVLITLIISVAPHIQRLIPWVILWCLVLWSYMFLSLRYRWQWPDTLLRTVLAVIGFGGVVMTFGIRFGGDAYLSLLAVTATLKPLEIRSYRDEMISLFLSYFIVITSLFNSESLGMTGYMFLSVLITTSVLIRIHHPDSPMKANLRLSAIIMVQAIPLMLMLFLLFPRIRGNLWGFTKGGGGRSGFSDSISPGSVSGLVRSNELAFRVEFSEKIPDPKFLYWRGLVFHEFDGRTWRVFPRTPGQLRPLADTKSDVSYTITLEPHEQRWLFAMDLPAFIPQNSRLSDDYTLQNRFEVRQKMRYQMRSYTEYHTGMMRRWESIDLKLPDAGNPRTRALSKQWVEKLGSPEKIVEAALNFYEKNKFVYTLNPPLLGADSIDDFLFNTRKGYCEHYASSFAFMMRSAGIPARVVGGYLGGEINPYGGYLIVRQSDAHAWTEVWLAQKGWVRVDPTSVVAPDRVERGVAGALSAEELPGFLISRGPFSTIWKTIRFGWDAVNNEWNIRVMGYSFENQKALLEFIGLQADSWKARIRLLLMAMGTAGIFVIILAFYFFKQREVKKQAVVRMYERFCSKLANAGIVRQPNQGPADYAAMAMTQRKDLKTQISEIVELYIRLRYGRESDPASLKKLNSLVNTFDPGRII